jgi:arylformamidase
MLYDISQELSPATAVFPGDTPFSARTMMRMSDGGSCDVGTITTSVHAGTHADAPAHFLAGGATIDRVPLAAYLGPARLVALALGRGEAIRPEHLEPLALRGAERLLFSTGTAPDPAVYNLDFAHFSVEAAAMLAGRGLKLVGIDTPSIDRWDSKTLAAHKVFAASGVALLENLVLGHVPPGDYELIALPLRLKDLDSSPVRAVLRRG